VAEGPEVEAEWYNFDALNIPPDHPAREMQDTLFVARSDGEPGPSGMVLRTHTSPVQIRSMLTRPLPLYVVSPGKVYRNEALDATHLPVFYQIEGLAVDEGLTMADLRGAIQAFVDALFGKGLRTRLRPDYFPFTEPSGDVSMECHLCRGESAKPGAPPCRTCRSMGWIEIAGCGMVNPRVLVACGIDPDRYSGFAFGLGVERALMLAHGINEIRDTYDGDVRFSRAFGTEI
jgi:phenylalanyl-tRNA synthetase alpha chain